MPLLNPSQIHEVLREELPAQNQKSQEPESLSKLLKRANLTSEEVLDHVSSEMRTGDTSSARLSAAKIGLQLNGLLDQDAIKPMNVTIIIQDSQFNQVNPILVPR